MTRDARWSEQVRLITTVASVEATLARSKNVSRRLLDRVFMPYVVDLSEDIRERLREADPSIEPPAAGVPSDFFHNALHELRTLELRAVRKGARRALSVGASGGWYFDWFEANYGELDRHVGVEAYEPRPDDLPPYAEWVESTADRFVGVDDDSVDLVFAGQTIEHLWADEFVGFLTESARVLPEGGLLVADSPNRLVTEHLNWSHGGHTIELSVTEWTGLLELAGFRVLRARGAWLCRFDDRIRQLEEGLDDGAVVVQRIALGGDRPDDSFVWWIDAERTDAAPDVPELRARIDALFEAHWNTRVSRGMWPGPGHPGPLLGGEDGRLVATGLPIMLHRGRWRLTVEAAPGHSLSDLDGLAARLRLPGPDALEGRRIGSDPSRAMWEFDLPHAHLALSVEVGSSSASRPVRLRMPVALECVRSGTGGRPAWPAGN